MPRLCNAHSTLFKVYLSWLYAMYKDCQLTFSRGPIRHVYMCSFIFPPYDIAAPFPMMCVYVCVSSCSTARQVMMPPGGATSRADQKTVLAAIVHGKRVEVGNLLRKFEEVSGYSGSAFYLVFVVVVVCESSQYIVSVTEHFRGSLLNGNERVMQTENTERHFFAANGTFFSTVLFSSNVYMF